MRTVNEKKERQRSALREIRAKIQISLVRNIHPGLLIDEYSGVHDFQQAVRMPVRDARSALRDPLCQIRQDLATTKIGGSAAAEPHLQNLVHDFDALNGK